MIRTFIFRVEITSGSDERWDELAQLPLVEAAKEVQADLEYILDDCGLIHTKVEQIGCKQDKELWDK